MIKGKEDITDKEFEKILLPLVIIEIVYQTVHLLIILILQ